MNFYLYVINLIRLGTKTVGKKVYVNQERLPNMLEMDRVVYSLVLFSLEEDKIRCFCHFVVVGREKVALPFLFVLAVGSGGGDRDFAACLTL